jgi:hypothetical protein
VLQKLKEVFEMTKQIGDRFATKIIVSHTAPTVGAKLVAEIEKRGLGFYFAPSLAQEQEALYQDLTKLGLKFAQIPSYSSISEFIKKIRRTDYVIMMISAAYLKNARYLQEVVELVKDDDFRERIIPVIADDVKLHNMEQELAYIQYWQGEVKRCEDQAQKVSAVYAGNLVQDAQRASRILIELSSFLGVLRDLHSIDLAGLQATNYQPLLEHIIRQSAAVNLKTMPVQTKDLATAINNQGLKIFFTHADEAAGEEEGEIISGLTQDFRTLGVEFKELEAYGDKEGFQRGIREADAVLMVISAAYLKSPESMYTILELVKDDDYAGKLMPIILKDAGIKEVGSELEYVSYWQDALAKKEALASGQALEFLEALAKDAKKRQQVLLEMGKFIAELRNRKPVPLKQLKKDNYAAVLQHILKLAEEKKSR